MAELIPYPSWCQKRGMDTDDPEAWRQYNNTAEVRAWKANAAAAEAECRATNAATVQSFIDEARAHGWTDSRINDYLQQTGLDRTLAATSR